MTKLYCYSATGNTLAVARRIAAVLGGCEIRPCAPVQQHPDCDRVGFLFPVYFGGMPRGFEAFLRDFPARADVDYFAVATKGAVAFNALHDVRDLLAEKGATLRYARSIRAVANCVLRYDVNQKRAAADAIGADLRADAAAREIQQGVVRTPGARIPLVGRFGSYPPPDADSAFVVNEQLCQKCGRCLRVCSRQNIDAINGSPLWNGNCDQCLACLHWCPAGAIDYGSRTFGKSRYTHPDVRADDLPR